MTVPAALSMLALVQTGSFHLTACLVHGPDEAQPHMAMS